MKNIKSRVVTISREYEEWELGERCRELCLYWWCLISLYQRGKKMAKYEELIQLCIYKSLLYPEQAFYSVSAKIRGSKTKRHRFQICGQNQRRQWPECMAFLMGGSRWSAAWMPWLWQRWVLRSLERWKPRTERGKEKRRKDESKCQVSYQ